MSYLAVTNKEIGLGLGLGLFYFCLMSGFLRSASKINTHCGSTSLRPSKNSASRTHEVRKDRWCPHWFVIASQRSVPELGPSHESGPYSHITDGISPSPRYKELETGEDITGKRLGAFHSFGPHALLWQAYSQSIKVPQTKSVLKVPKSSQTN